MLNFRRLGQPTQDINAGGTVEYVLKGAMSVYTLFPLFLKAGGSPLSKAEIFAHVDTIAFVVGGTPQWEQTIEEFDMRQKFAWGRQAADNFDGDGFLPMFFSEHWRPTMDVHEGTALHLNGLVNPHIRIRLKSPATFELHRIEIYADFRASEIVAAEVDRSEYLTTGVLDASTHQPIDIDTRFRVHGLFVSNPANIDYAEFIIDGNIVLEGSPAMFAARLKPYEWEPDPNYLAIRFDNRRRWSEAYSRTASAKLPNGQVLNTTANSVQLRLKTNTTSSYRVMAWGRGAVI